MYFFGETYHLLIRQLAPLNAAAVSHGLLVPLSLNVTEQVNFRGDLKTQTQRSQVTRGDPPKRKPMARDVHIHLKIRYAIIHGLTVLICSDLSKLNLIPWFWLTSAKLTYTSNKSLKIRWRRITITKASENLWRLRFERVGASGTVVG